VEWDLLDRVQVSGGVQRTKYGVKDGYQSDMSFAVSSYSYGLGAGFKLNEKLKLNIAYFWTVYGDYTKTSENYNGTTLPGKDVYTRTNKVFGIGVDYKF
jgi:long-chain fatty acid transport protein